MTMVLVITEPDGTKKHYNIGDATPTMASAYADECLRRHPIGSTWAYSVTTQASWDAEEYRREMGDLPPEIEEAKRKL